jgi:hypothetical protein
MLKKYPKNVAEYEQYSWPGTSYCAKTITGTCNIVSCNQVQIEVNNFH